MPDEAPVISAVALGLGSGNATGWRLSQAIWLGTALSMLCGMEEPFNPFGDPEELRRRLGEFAEQMEGAQRVSFADNAIRLAVELTVASVNRLNLQGTSDEQAMQVRDAIRIVFPEAVTLVLEAREGLS